MRCFQELRRIIAHLLRQFNRDFNRVFPADGRAFRCREIECEEYTIRVAVDIFGFRMDDGVIGM